MLESAFLIMCLGHTVDHDLVRAISHWESSGNKYALYINKWKMDQFKNLTLDEAVLVAEKMVEEGYTVDVGLMGINSNNIERFNMSVKEAYDPCVNVHLGGHILYENMQFAAEKGKSGDDLLKTALSLYNTGTTTFGFKNGYVDRVWKIYSASTEYKANQAGIDIPWGNETNLIEIKREKPTWKVNSRHE